MGISEVEAESWWLELNNNPRTQRGDRGFRGRFQLWIPLGESKDNERANGITDAVTEASKGERGYTGEDVELLMEHIHRQQTSLADRFITMAAPEDNLSLKRSAEDAELDNKASDGKEDSKQPVRKRWNSSTQTMTRQSIISG